jgi:hypothetical protein
MFYVAVLPRAGSQSTSWAPNLMDSQNVIISDGFVKSPSSRRGL